MLAVEQANRVISWQENLTDEEMPPEWMWHMDFELEPWFEEVKRKREDRFGGGGRDETVPMMDNELARGRR